MQERQSHDMRYMSGPPVEFRRVPMHCLLCRSRQQQHLLQLAANTGCIRMKRATTTDTDTEA